MKTILTRAKFRPEQVTSSYSTLRSALWESPTICMIEINLKQTRLFLTSGKFFLGRPLFAFPGTSAGKGLSFWACSSLVSCEVSVAVFSWHSSVAASCGSVIVRAVENYFGAATRESLFATFGPCVLNFYDPALGFCNLSGIFPEFVDQARSVGGSVFPVPRIDDSSWSALIRSLQVYAVVFNYANHSQIYYRVGCRLIDEYNLVATMQLANEWSIVRQSREESERPPLFLWTCRLDWQTFEPAGNEIK